MSKAKDNPSQLTFSVLFPAVVAANGDGFTVRPGKPVLKLSPAQLATQFAVERHTIYRWRAEGLIPEAFVTFGGKRKLRFDAAVVAHLEAHFKTLHGD
ncbi:MAG TPA: helix-turn-helix domain-containing protein [Candidatus Binatia bacterium]|jgi:hypothetical protein|nr:helix-turn-helix domain-containing protein [Candidatus Binatia bacterium]